MNDDNKWVCASNCVFTGTVAAGSDVLGGNNKTNDMATDEEKESGKTWRIPPSSGVIKHGEYHNFKCNAAGSMYEKQDHLILNQEKMFIWKKFKIHCQKIV